ncbi:MAG TPA: hypothetical protein VNZ61_02545 [Roseomonas sp.]|nr:hypothetical protein [Roseomonas sp.]
MAKGKPALYPVKDSRRAGAPVLINHGNVLPMTRSARASLSGSVAG